MSSPRLRHSPSLTLQPQGRRVSTSSSSHPDPFASLGLKVSMPTHIQQTVMNPTSRPKTISNMYMLGLGARSAGRAFGSPSPRNAFTSPMKSSYSPKIVAPQSSNNADNDSDIE
jgi:hypothetical protein